VVVKGTNYGAQPIATAIHHKLQQLLGEAAPVNPALLARLPAPSGGKNPKKSAMDQFGRSFDIYGQIRTMIGKKQFNTIFRSFESQSPTAITTSQIYWFVIITPLDQKSSFKTPRSSNETSLFRSSKTAYKRESSYDDTNVRYSIIGEFIFIVE
jgi:hypothetical protein